MDDITKSVQEMLLKKALGYTVDEVVEEFSEDKDGEFKLTKRKVTKKYLPPDVSAGRILMELSKAQPSLQTMTDEQLAQERKRLLTLLSQETEDENGKM